MFVDDDFKPHPDQWAYLASLSLISVQAVETAILSATGGAHPLDVTSIADEDQQEPWKRVTAVPKKLPGEMPKALTVTLANMIYFEKAHLPQSLANRLIRLAAFQNPEFAARRDQ